MAGLVALTALTGCQTWQDRADARALETCEKLGEADARARCRETVIETERARQQEALDDLELQIQQSEERERLNEVFGDPGK
ncbi:hypothetical protein [Hyphomonas sp.]|uniref:hypothetical protein n=1 Tax=Hyphomonas sp. TaxID=87 RepID=UPI0025C310C1|nr:hypothetical protein [Hyphomonas sp.]